MLSASVLATSAWRSARTSSDSGVPKANVIIDLLEKYCNFVASSGDGGGGRDVNYVDKDQGQRKKGGGKGGKGNKGRKGKGVTIVTGIPLTGKELTALAKKLKQRCGSGGTVRDGVIEIQGEHRDTIVAELEKTGWTVKRSGG